MNDEHTPDHELAVAAALDFEGDPAGIEAGVEPKLYTGRRTAAGCQVRVNGRRLPLRLDLWNHSPSGFEWGYAGSGPAQLALAILADHFGARPRSQRMGAQPDPAGQRAVDLHQKFKFAVVTKLERAGWLLSSDQVQRVVEAIEANPEAA